MSECLDLVLKNTYYDMIVSGIKREEYREIKPYWTKRIAGLCSWCWKKKVVKNCLDECDGLKYIQRHFRKINFVRFHRGYTSTTTAFAVREVAIDMGNPEWGAKAGKLYYVIRLGEKLI